MELQEYETMYDLEKSYWWFTGKQYLVRQRLHHFLSGGPGPRKILDIGAGTGIVLKLLEDYGSVYGIELSQRAIEFLRKRGLDRIVRADAGEPLPFKDESFSAVTCLDVLEHVDGDASLLKEIMRVCRTGGCILVTVPALMLFWSPHDVVLHHKRRYTLRTILELVDLPGCRVVAASYFNILFSIPILFVRTLRGLSGDACRARSDFRIHLPLPLNRLFAFLFRLEIRLSRLVRYPFGVSIVLLLQKTGRGACEGREV
jgi:SAM-dependent methyltransferase